MFIQEWRWPLDEDMTRQLKLIAETCKKQDNTQGGVKLNSLEINCQPNIPAVMTAEEDGKIIGYLSLFMPSGDEGEISGYVLPQYRRLGFFREMLTRMAAHLRAYDAQRMLLVGDYRSDLFLRVTAGLHTRYAFTEYTMELDAQKFVPAKGTALTMTPAGDSDVEGLVQVSVEAFGDSAEDARGMTMRMIASRDRTLYAARVDGVYVGMAGAHDDGERIVIFGVGILPECRRRGYAHMMMTHVINDALGKNRRVTLEVDSLNAAAYALYEKMGFVVVRGEAYYEIRISDMAL